MKILKPIVFLIAACGCNWGTRPENFSPALGPQGAHVTLRVVGEKTVRVGELIAVDSIGITIRTDQFRRVVWTRIAAMNVHGMEKEVDIRPGEVVTSEKRARLALVSRFPQGIARVPITLDSLISQASRSTERFADRRVAVAEGYRRVGADFPGMGEHWVNSAMLLSNRIDPAHPTMLTYASVAGAPTLLGVGFMVVTHGDASASSAPGWPDAWHEHSGLLADESAVADAQSHGAASTHVWVLHVWTALPNPAGATAPDNWALPYVRAGLPLPHHVDEDASRALSLQHGGDQFVRDMLTDAGLRTAQNALAIDSVVAIARGRAVGVSRDDGDSGDLGETWRALATSLEQIAGADVRRFLAASHHGGHQ